MRYLNSPLLTLLVLAGLLALARYSLVHERTDLHGNSRAKIEAFYAAHKSSAETIVALYTEEGEPI